MRLIITTEPHVPGTPQTTAHPLAAQYARDMLAALSEGERPFTVEPGAEGLPQTVIPGAEHETVEEAKARADRAAITESQQLPKANSGKVQKPNDQGLFAPPPPAERTLFQRQAAQPTFFSALTRGAENLRLDKGSADQWRNTIKNLPGVKDEERAWSGIDDFLKSKKGAISKADVLQHLRENEVRVQEVVHGDASAALTPEEQTELASIRARQWQSRTPYERDRLHGLEDKIAKASQAPKFGTYVLPGGPLSRDTEILTANGWLRMDAVRVGDVALTRKDRHGTLEWQTVEAVPTVFAPELFHFFNQSVNMMVTKDHQMVVKRRRRSSAGMMRVTAEKLWKMSECVIPLTGSWRGGDDDSLFGLDAGDVAEFVGWYLAEGSYKHRNGHKNTIQIAQCDRHNPKHCERIRALCERLGLKSKYYGGAFGVGVRGMPSGLRELLHAQPTSEGKFIPRLFFQKSGAVIGRLLEGLMLGDGCVTPAKGVRKAHAYYFTKSARLAGDVQAIVLLAGKHARVRRRKAGLYVVTIADREWASVDDAKHAIVPYNDTAFCVTVKNHAIYVRRNGVAAFTGNSNYRELLLTTPPREATTGEVATRLFGHPMAELTPEQRAQVAEEMRSIETARSNGYAPKGQDFRGPHWDEPNVLAHVRFDDRTGANGERVLHVAEIQSDWHASGRKRGYVSEGEPAWQEARRLKDQQYDLLRLPENEGKRAAEIQQSPAYKDLEARIQALLQKKATATVPDAPFKSTEAWASLALKRMIRYAAENGYDRLSFDTGDTNAERYDLSKRVREVFAARDSAGTYLLSAKDHQGNTILHERLSDPSKFDDYVGKDVADRLREGINRDDHAKLSGLDLKVGGEGMKGFYDKILPAAANKIGKKFGAKVEEGSIGDSKVGWSVPTHSLPITDAMRESVMQGQPLFQHPTGWDVAEGGGEIGHFKPARTPSGEHGERVALTDDLIATLPKNPGPQERAIMADVAKIAQRIVPSARVTAAHALEIGDKFCEQAKSAPEGRVMGATYTNGMRRLIAWSLESPDAIGTLRHEAIHWLLGTGFIKPAEWDFLRKAAERENWIGKHYIDARYPDAPHDLKIEEAIAEEFSRWRRAPSRLPPFIAKTFGRMQQLLQQVGDHVRRAFGQDATANDVFSRIESGEVGKRPLQTRMERQEPQFQAARREPAEGEREPSRTRYGIYKRVMGEGADAVGRRISEAIDRYMPDPIRELGEQAKLGVAPMAAGTPRARAAAKDFMNTQRRTDHEWGKVDEHLEKTFTPEERKAMWDAGDEENDIRREGRTPGPDEGLNRLPPKQRAVMDELSKRGRAALDVAKEKGMVHGEGVNYWVPRMVVNMGDEGARRIGSGAERVGSTGRNLTTTTGSLKQRKYATAAETEAAAQEHFGEGATVVRDVRTMALGIKNLEKAIAGRTLIDRIKEMGKTIGEPTVEEGGTTRPGDFFTLDHPAFRTWKPKFITNEDGKVVPAVDQNGQTQFEARPLYVSREFQGPLKAVLSTAGNKFYQAAMDLKGKMMSVIMYSPLMHNQVIWGKALPAAPLKLLTPFYKDEKGELRAGIQIYGEGAVARRNPEMMRRALDAGMDPIGHRYFNQDITAIAEPPQIAPGRSLTAKAIGNSIGLFDKGGGESVKRAIDNFGDFWHNTMLWDRVGDLQAGIFQTLSEHFEKEGMSQQSADRAAAHFANRYAGSLPIESMSKGARMTANLMLFSRSFTLGNLGAYKDFTLGLPRDVQAQILRDKGVQELATVQSAVRRKALAMLGIDIALSRLGNYMAAYATHAVRQAMGQPNQFQAPAQNEPGKTDRFLIGYAEDGRAIYGRLPTGKVGEELSDWATEPVDTLKRKLSPYARLLYEVAANDRGFGQKLYDPYDQTPGGLAKAVGKIALAGMDSVLPTQMVGSGLGLALNPETKAAVAPVAESYGVTIPRSRSDAALGVALPAAGITLSHGAPGGPEAGFYYRGKDEQQFQIGEQMPEIRSLVAAGRTAEAEKRMEALGMDKSYQRWVIRTSEHPETRVSPRQQQLLQQHGFIPQQ